MIEECRRSSNLSNVIIHNSEWQRSSNLPEKFGLDESATTTRTTDGRVLVRWLRVWSDHASALIPPNGLASVVVWLTNTCKKTLSNTCCYLVSNRWTFVRFWSGIELKLARKRWNFRSTLQMDGIFCISISIGIWHSQAIHVRWKSNWIFFVFLLPFHNRSNALVWVSVRVNGSVQRTGFRCLPKRIDYFWIAWVEHLNDSRRTHSHIHIHTHVHSVFVASQKSYSVIDYSKQTFKAHSMTKNCNKGNAQFLAIHLAFQSKETPFSRSAKNA